MAVPVLFELLQSLRQPGPPVFNCILSDSDLESKNGPGDEGCAQYFRGGNGTFEASCAPHHLDPALAAVSSMMVQFARNRDTFC